MLQGNIQTRRDNFFFLTDLILIGTYFKNKIIDVTLKGKMNFWNETFNFDR
jgi:hypothetical protein